MASSQEQEFDHWLEAQKSEKHYWRHLWSYRELFFILAWRDISIRYKQTIAGASWSLFQPLFSMVIMTLVFGKIAGLPSEGSAPYPLLVFSALLPWQFFSNSLNACSHSVISNGNLISKVYFPRLIVPVSSVMVALVDVSIAFTVLIAMMIYYQFLPSLHFLTLPLFILVGACFALGPGLLTAAMNVKFRDFKIIIPYMLQIGMYLSPVAYSSQVITQKFGPTMGWIYSLNPMVGVIDGFRWALLRGEPHMHWGHFGLSSAVALLTLTLGLRYFRKVESTFADSI